MSELSPRWNRNDSNEAHVELTRMFQDGEIEPGAQVKALWETNELFRQYSLGVFRTAYYELRALFGHAHNNLYPYL